MSKKFPLIAGLVLAALLAAGVVYYLKTRAGSDAADSQRKGSAPVSVVVGKVSLSDTPIYLDGIGTVSAYNTVTVHTRVDGQIDKIHFTEGQDVKAGDLLATIDARPFQAQLDQALAKKAQDAATLANAKLDLGRDTFLLAQNLIDQQSVDTQRSLVAQGTALVQADDAAIESAQVQVNYTRVTAPISGRVGLRLVDEGNVVHASDTSGLVIITQLQPVSVVFTLPQQNLRQIQKAVAATPQLKVIAYGDDSRSPIDTGALAVVSNQIDTTTGTVSLKATFPNQALLLWPGQFVNVRLLVDTRKDGIVVPASVIQRGPDGSFAFVVADDQTVSARPVTVAQIDGTRALIDQGLSAGETVIVDGQYKLQIGSRVTIAPPPGAAPATDAPATGDTPARAHKHKKPASE